MRRATRTLPLTGTVAPCSIYDAMSDGGQVAMPLQSMFWGADFGVLIDKFGVTWMVNYTYPQE